jgi:hypothetical protein
MTINWNITFFITTKHPGLSAIHHSLSIKLKKHFLPLPDFLHMLLNRLVRKLYSSKQNLESGFWSDAISDWVTWLSVDMLKQEQYRCEENIN